MRKTALADVRRVEETKEFEKKLLRVLHPITSEEVRISTTRRQDDDESKQST